jgi:hypothetical protein
MICSSLNLDRFIVRLPYLDGLYIKLELFQGLRSTVTNIDYSTAGLPPSPVEIGVLTVGGLTIDRTLQGSLGYGIGSAPVSVGNFNFSGPDLVDVPIEVDNDSDIRVEVEVGVFGLGDASFGGLFGERR